MKKLFLIGVFAFGLIFVSFANSAANMNEANVSVENCTYDNDGWENVGKATATATISHRVGDSYVFSTYEGILYVKIIASKVLYKFVYQGREYSVAIMNDSYGEATINDEACWIRLPFVDA